ncbi:hypothetical protein [Alteromonas sediminis]|uniref:hypothetical protein n=1 Tax=Alteromonas sediminis TaxID=2259342 RepID=UPI001F0B85B0|nr:hypothetical protein [Alteromonas sediminis]
MTEVIYYQLDTDGLFDSGELSDVGLDLLCILKLARYVSFLKSQPEAQSNEWLTVQDDILGRLNMDEQDLENMCEQTLEELSEQ